MVRRVVDAALRTRALVWGTLSAAFAALLTYVTARVALSGEWFDTAIAVALTAGLWYQVVRWYRKFRRV
jgi:hypothetical protein